MQQLKLKNGAEIYRIDLRAERLDYMIEGVVLARYRDEFVTWSCQCADGETEFETLNGNYFSDDYDAALADYLDRVRRNN